MYITTSCEKPELAAQWLDYLYTDEGARYLWYGIEGETYEFDENNEPQFTEMVIHPAEEGVSPQQILQKYCLSWGDCWIAKHDISASHKISTAAAGGVNQELEAVGVWSEPSINLALPNRSMTLTEDESYEITNIQTTLSTMIQEYTVNYIIGADVIPFEEFQQQLVEFGLEDVGATYQAAYDRYYAR